MSPPPEDVAIRCVQVAEELESLGLPSEVTEPIFNWARNIRGPGHNDVAKQLRLELASRGINYNALDHWIYGRAQAYHGGWRLLGSWARECVRIAVGSEIPGIVPYGLSHETARSLFHDEGPLTELLRETNMIQDEEDDHEQP